MDATFDRTDPFSVKESKGLISEKEQPLCALCKGVKMLCGKERCPILVKFYAKLKNAPRIDAMTLYGSAPGVFVGRHGYPMVSIGPLVPPVIGDTSEMDTPERWIGKTIDDIVGFRSSLVRGMYKVNVRKPEKFGKIVENMALLSMAENPVDTNAEFYRKPSGRIELDDEVQPFGPSAPLKKADLGNFRLDDRIEKAYHDTDLMARDAVVELYGNDTLVTRIQRAFSMGAFGAKKTRRIVPTRQSITAVDSIIGETLMDQVRILPVINEYRVFESWQLDNRFIVLMLPEPWSYELVEAWYPDTVWNPAGREIMIISDAERFEGRTTYASIGGCYYAARLATCEYLLKEGRQAKVVILREAHSGYIMPVGVWNVRENVRAALKGPCERFNSLETALTHIQTKFDIPISRWTRNSFILKDSRFQRRLTDF
ncbi:MAG: Nre family DNA repair protein [Methanocella sp.]